MIFKITNSFTRNVGEQVCLCAYGEFLYYRKYLGVEFMKGIRVQFHCCSLAQSDLCDPMDCSPLGLCPSPSPKVCPSSCPLLKFMSVLLGIIEVLSKVALSFSLQTVLCESFCHFMSLLMFNVVQLLSGW